MSLYVEKQLGKQLEREEKLRGERRWKRKKNLRQKTSISCIVCVFTQTIATYCTANNTVTSLSAREKKEISIECSERS